MADSGADRGQTVRRRIGLYGGSFDPIHLGHVILAVEAVEAGRLDELVLIPARQSPLKSKMPEIAGEHRLAMAELAVAPFEHLSVWAGEVYKPEPSYTFDTVAAWQSEHPEAKLFWIIGADQAQDLPRWHRIEDLATRVTFLVTGREDTSPEPAEPVSGLRLERIATRRIDVSSTEIRERQHAGRAFRHLMPGPVADYLLEHGL